MEENFQMMTLGETADLLRCHRSTIYRLLKTGEIPALKMGSDWRFLKSDIMQWVTQRRVNLDALK